MRALSEAAYGETSNTMHIAWEDQLLVHGTREPRKVPPIGVAGLLSYPVPENRDAGFQANIKQYRACSSIGRAGTLNARRREH